MDNIDRRLNELVQALKPTAIYSPELNLIDDLQVDSLDLIDFFFEVEQEFNIIFDVDDAASMISYPEVCEALGRYIAAK